MSVDKKMPDEEMIAKIAAKVLDSIKGKPGTVCQGYYCDSAAPADGLSLWADVLKQHSVALDDAALKRVSALPLTNDEVVQVAVELKTSGRDAKSIAEKDAEAAVHKVLADNVLIARRAGDKAVCVPGGPDNAGQHLFCKVCGPNRNQIACAICGPNNGDINCSSCGPNSGIIACAICGPNNSGIHCSSCGPNHNKVVCAICGPNTSGISCSSCGPNNGLIACSICGPNNGMIDCAVCGPNRGSIMCSSCGPNNAKIACSSCGPVAAGHHYEQCNPGFTFNPGGCGGAYDPMDHQFDPRDIIRLSEQVAQLAAEVQKLRTMK